MWPGKPHPLPGASLTLVSATAASKGCARSIVAMLRPDSVKARRYVSSCSAPFAALSSDSADRTRGRSISPRCADSSNRSRCSQPRNALSSEGE